MQRQLCAYKAAEIADRVSGARRKKKREAREKSGKMAVSEMAWVAERKERIQVWIYIAEGIYLSRNSRHERL